MRPRRTPRSVRLFGFFALAAALFFSSLRVSAAEFKLERQFPLERGGTFVLEAAAGTVDVIGDSTSGVSVTVPASNGPAIDTE